MQSIQNFAPRYLGVHLSGFKIYFLHVQCIQYLAPKYLRVHLYNFKKKILLTREKYSNTLHLNTLGSIYLASKKYFLHMQSIHYFALKFLQAHLSNFKRILLARAKYSILCTYTPKDPFIQIQKNTFCMCQLFNTLHLNTWGSIFTT